MAQVEGSGTAATVASSVRVSGTIKESPLVGVKVKLSVRMSS